MSETRGEMRSAPILLFRRENANRPQSLTKMGKSSNIIAGFRLYFQFCFIQQRAKAVV